MQFLFLEESPHCIMVFEAESWRPCQSRDRPPSPPHHQFPHFRPTPAPHCFPPLPDIPDLPPRPVHCVDLFAFVFLHKCGTWRLVLCERQLLLDRREFDFGPLQAPITTLSIFVSDILWPLDHVFYAIRGRQGMLLITTPQPHELFHSSKKRHRRRGRLCRQMS